MDSQMHILPKINKKLRTNKTWSQNERMYSWERKPQVGKYAGQIHASVMTVITFSLIHKATTKI
jgi:hypothetical protein